MQLKKKYNFSFKYAFWLFFPGNYILLIFRKSFYYEVWLFYRVDLVYQVVYN